MKSINSFVNELLQTEDDNLLYADDCPAIWIDWREDDRDIVNYCCVDGLTSEICNTDNSSGYELHIVYQGKRRQVCVGEGEMNRDPTLKAISYVLSPEYKLCFLTDSSGGDTLAFIVLSNDEWEYLEYKYGKNKLESHLLPVKDDTEMFGID